MIRRILFALALVLAPAVAFAQSLAGVYDCQGRNPNGSTYSGTVTVSQNGGELAFSWDVGSSYRGTGFQDGRVVTIDWGDANPVVYVVMPNGALHGTWANGLALERLTPR